MKIYDDIKVSGHFEIHSLDGKLLAEADNKEVVVGLNLLANLLIGTAGYTGLNYMAIGTGTTAVAAAQTQLTTETKRNRLTIWNVSNGSTTSVLVIQTFYLGTVCSVFIKEAGLFGNGATGTANSGTMFNRSLISFDNSSLKQDLILTANLTFSSTT